MTLHSSHCMGKDFQRMKFMLLGTHGSCLSLCSPLPFPMGPVSQTVLCHRDLGLLIYMFTPPPMLFLPLALHTCAFYPLNILPSLLCLPLLLIPQNRSATSLGSLTIQHDVAAPLCSNITLCKPLLEDVGQFSLWPPQVSTFLSLKSLEVSTYVLPHFAFLYLG